MNSSSARIGYARVSTANQNLDAQIAALEAAHCTMIRTETGDGATLTGRPELKTILDFAPYRTRPQERFLKRQLSLPVSMISQWWVRRSSSAVVILGSPKTEGHSPKARLVVMTIEVRS